MKDIQTWIVALIVLASVVYIVRKYIFKSKSKKQAACDDCGCSHCGHHCD